MRLRAKVGLTVLGAAAACVSGWFVLLRPWQRHWGATEDEVSRPMPGDELVPAPNYATTRAITVRARPDEIWPWLAQMGNGRGGLYSVDWLDQLFGVLDSPSAKTVLPQWQDLKPGDEIPMANSPGWPVWAVEREKSLVLRIEQGGILVTNSWGLFPVDAETTRLVLRVRALAPAGWRTTLLLAGIEPEEFVMVRAQLRGVRERAEGLAQTRRSQRGAMPQSAAPP